jgi:hypothetical protein
MSAAKSVRVRVSGRALPVLRADMMASAFSVGEMFLMGTLFRLSLAGGGIIDFEFVHLFYTTVLGGLASLA